MISTVIVAFSMFSAIPMPQTEWTNKSMRYALCAFPLIGAVIGALVCLWRFVCLRMEFSEWILAAGICVLPVLVTGGIHLDGFCDTADALASHQDTEKKLQILKDPHMGAFAAIWLGCYFIAQLALAVTAAQMQADLTALAFGYVNAALGALTPLAERALRIDERDIQTGVDFQAERPRIDARIVCTIRIGQIVIIALAFGAGFLKQKMHAKQARAARAKTAPATQERKVSNG